MSVTREGGKGSRPAGAQRNGVRGYVLVAALLSLTPLAHAQDYDFVVAPLPDETARPGREWDVVLEFAHTCPATGRIRVLVQGDAGIEATANDAVWGDCGSDGYSRATASMRVKVLANATAGAHGVGVAGFWEGHQTRQTVTMQVTVPFVATARLSGPTEGVVLPGRTVEVPVRVNLTANADVWLLFSAAAPEGWKVFGAQPTTVDTVDGTGEVVQRIAFTAPSGATGDVPIVITALPMDALSHRESGQAGTHRWTARLPPKLQSESPPATTAPAGAAGEEPEDVTTFAPASKDDGMPAWLIAAALIGAGALAFWWTRRKG